MFDVRARSPSGRATDALVLVAAKLALGAWVLHAGFTHVSDDDYARTVIAEQFAHAPRLDPSGTSWLPAPFWIEGLVMMVLGRSLAAARAVAMGLGAASVAAPYIAMRVVGMKRAAAIAATAVAMTLPWNMWLGVATVPEGWAGALVAAAAIAMPVERARPWAATGLLIAALSRYEAWPACAIMAVLCLWNAARGAKARRSTELLCAQVAVTGPIAWMLWNAHAHGSALHFVARVTSFRRAIGAADAPLVEKLLDYPAALASDAAVAALLGAIGVAGLLRPELRKRHAWPFVTAVATLAFLVWGDLHDGAPTHHAARALVAIWWILVAAGADTLASLFTRERRILAYATGALLAATTAATLLVHPRSAPPGTGEADAREAQIARGLDLRARHVLHADVTPCAFEHFAMLAAWGAPERANVGQRTGEPVTPECPTVVER